MAAPIPAAARALDHMVRAQRFHRRAQAAEADAQHFLRWGTAWLARYVLVERNRNTVRRKLKRARARVRRFRHKDPLTRIIELGREFP